MRLHNNDHFRLWLLLMGCISILIIQSVWAYRAYQMQYRHIMAEIEDAFYLAYQKEQTYRIPVVDIVNSGGVKIQSCDNEEITVVQECHGDTIVYNNISGYSIVDFLNRAFWDLRENMVPMNIYCLADLFGGMLHDKNIAASFAVERYNTRTGEVIESSLYQDEKRLKMTEENTLIAEISGTESVRAILHITPGIVLGSMPGLFVLTTLLSLVIIVCFILLYRKQHTVQNRMGSQNPKNPEKPHDNTFVIGKFEFDPDKNELRGFGEAIQLNKKENAILYALCIQHGNIVERNTLLEENWGNSGIIYSRSLDTYLTTLRKYLKRDPSIQIITVKGVGYKLVIAE